MVRFYVNDERSIFLHIPKFEDMSASIQATILRHATDDRINLDLTLVDFVIDSFAKNMLVAMTLLG
jgi:hypothetical protein